MATLITRVDQAQGLSGSPDQRLRVAPDGTLWEMVVDADRARFFRSTNGGTTWAYSSGSDLDLGFRQAYPTWNLDESGNAIVSWVNTWSDPQTVRVARGRPRSGGGWSWSALTISPAEGRMNSDSTVVVFRNGAGWTAFVSWHNDSGSAVGARVSQVVISATGVAKVAKVIAGPPATGGNIPVSMLEFAHVGDGLTPAAAPHLFLVAGARFNTQPLRAYRARYESGNWTWEAPVTLDAGVAIPTTSMVTLWDGDRLNTVWAVGESAVLRFAEWDGVGAPARRDPPALPAGLGRIGGVQLSHDPTTDDLYLACYDTTDGDIRVVKLTRASATWGAWATAQARNSGGGDGKLHLVQHAPADSVDMVWGNPRSGGDDYDVNYAQLVALTRAPSAPALGVPANGDRLDLAQGGTFTWRHAKVSSGDSQVAFAFRRVSGTTVEFWNVAAQAWSATEVWNPTTDERTSFPPGRWVTGTTSTWTVRTRGKSGGDSPYATARTVTATVAPVVVVTAPYGIAYGESTPLVEWTVTSTEAQRSFEVRIVPVTGGIDANNPGPLAWGSGVEVSAIARQRRVETPLSDAVAYRAYVQVVSASGVASKWAYSDFVVSVDPPSGPLVEVVDEITYETDVPRARLNIIARSNFLSADAAIGIDGWEADTNATVADAVPDDATGIEPGLAITSAASGLMSARTTLGAPPAAPYGQPQPAGPLTFPVMSGQAYTALGHVRMAAASRAARLRIRWYSADDGTGTLVGESVGEQVVASTSVYTPAYVTATAPFGAALGRAVVEVLGATGAGEVAYATRLSAHPGRDLSWQAGGYVPKQVVRVERSDDLGLTWSTLLERIKPNLAQRAVGIDRLLPLNTDTQYRAFTDVDTGTGAVLSSAASPLATVVVESDLWALRDPVDELAEFNALVTDFRLRDEETATVTRLAGQLYPIVDSEGPQGYTGTLDIFVPASVAERAADLLRRPTGLVVQSPAGVVMRLRLLKRDYTPEAIRARTITAEFVQVG